MVVLSPASFLIYTISIASLLFLAALGAIGAKVGGANFFKATARVTFWGAFAMALTAGIGTRWWGPRSETAASAETNQLGGPPLMARTIAFHVEMASTSDLQIKTVDLMEAVAVCSELLWAEHQ